MKNRKLLSILFVSMVMLSTTQCSDDEGVTYSVTDVSTRITGFSNSKTGPGADLTINGSKLQNVQRIFIGDKVIPAHEFISHTESAITFTVPVSVVPNTNDEKTDVLIVFSGSDRAYNEIEVVPLQAISSFTPYSAAAGETVTLVGFNFDLVTGVKIGEIDATITSNTPTVLKFTMPAGAATDKITLVGDAGNTKSTADIIFCPGGTSAQCGVALNTNSDFELGSGDDFDTWSKANGGQFMFATTALGEYYKGSRAIKVVRDGTLNSGEWRIQLKTNAVTTEIGASYTVYLWVRASGAGGSLRMSLTPDTGFYPANIAATTTWQQISFTVPGGNITTTSTQFVFDMNGNNTCCNPAINFFIDDVKVIKN